MIPCRITTDESTRDSKGWSLHSCARCNKTWHMAGHHSTWKGDPVLCKAWPDWWEFGWWIALVLAAIGIDVGRVNRTYRWLNMKPCGCGKRIEVANTIGSRFATWLRSIKTPW